MIFTGQFFRVSRLQSQATRILVCLIKMIIYSTNMFLAPTTCQALRLQEYNYVKTEMIDPTIRAVTWWPTLEERWERLSHEWLWKFIVLGRAFFLPSGRHSTQSQLFVEFCPRLPGAGSWHSQTTLCRPGTPLRLPGTYVLCSPPDKVVLRLALWEGKIAEGQCPFPNRHLLSP